MSELLTTTLQESLLILLATNEKEGRVAAGLIDHTAFDENYRDVAQRIIAFHKQHGTCPGKTHLDDVLDDVLTPDHKRQKQYVRIVEGILAQADSLNAPYVLSRLHDFVRRQTLKAAILEAGEAYQAAKESVVSDVEGILAKALRPNTADLDTGLFLNAPKALGFLETTTASFKTYIPELDKVNIGPTYGEMLVFMAAKGAGKSWFVVDIGTKCILQKAKVLHVTLEMSEERVAQRYYQRFFAIGKRKEEYDITKFEFDDYDRISGFKKRKRSVKVSLDSPDIKAYLKSKMKVWGVKLGRLLIKGFPTKSLTIAKLESYLNLIELQHNFIPNVLIVDYPDLMWVDKDNARLSIGITLEELRGLLQKRNLAGIFPTQTNRAGWDAATVKGSMVAEDASKFRTADMVLIYSRTPDEKERNLARLYVEKNRNDEGEFSVVISQAYKTGQFVVSSARMYPNYFDVLGTDANVDADANEDGGEDD